MKPLKYIIDAVKIDLKQYTDDDRISYLDDYLIEKADDIRATLIRAEYVTDGRLDEKYYQSTCCIEVECLNQGCVINGTTIPSGTVIWKADLPSLISGVGYYDLKYLGLDDYQTPFKRVSLTSFTNSGGDIWNQKDVYFHITGNTAYFKNLPTSGIKFICGIGLWAKPTSLCNYKLATDIYPVPSTNKLQVLMRMDVLKSWGYVLGDTKHTGKDETLSPTTVAKDTSNTTE